MNLRLSFKKITQILYLILSFSILLSGLAWCGIILIEVVDKGRMPIEADARFIKGIKSDIAFWATLGMIYGTAFWIILSGIAIGIKAMNTNRVSFLIGLIGLIINSLIFYLIFYSTLGQWILD